MEISINGKGILEIDQPQAFHREDFVYIKIHDTIEHIYIYRENRSEKFVAFGLTYPNHKGIPLKEIESVANKLRFLKKHNISQKRGYISYRTEIADVMVTPFVVVMCKLRILLWSSSWR